MQDKIRVSVAIITKNEEKNIARCLESVQWADEVIVVDGFSADRTVEIAVSLGAKVIQHKFTGAFADDRNIGMENSRNDWVLHLDADDVVATGFPEKLREALARKEDCAAYKFRRINFFLGRRMNHGGFGHYIPNLVNKRFVRYEGVVHEVPSCKGAIGTLEADVEHYPFDSIHQFIDRQNRYTDIAAKELLKKEGVLSEKEIRKHMVNKSVKIFVKSYIKKQGFRDGFHGLLFAALFSFINFMKWAKYWELVSKEPKT